MLVLRKKKNNVTLTFIVLSLLVMIFITPALAKKGRSHSGRSSRNDTEHTRVAKTSRRSSSRQPRSTIRAQKNVARTARVTRKVKNANRQRSSALHVRKSTSRPQQVRASSRSNSRRNTRTVREANRRIVANTQVRVTQNRHRPRQTRNTTETETPRTTRTVTTRRSGYTTRTAPATIGSRDRLGTRSHNRSGRRDGRRHSSSRNHRSRSRFSIGINLGGFYGTSGYYRNHRYWSRHRYSRLSWPRYRHIVRYRHGPRFSFRYVYPNYHRRYIFISLGGYWPSHYRYRRYYWYGYHPYYWYGHYPTVYSVEGDTNNYYTYNYNDTSYVTNGIRPVDADTFADVRERLAAQAADPDAETLADTYFDEAVQAFEAGDYDTAIEKFAQAAELEPDDMVLPFAYAQALFANEQYNEAARVLTKAIGELTPDKEGLFFPRGLYTSDDVLFEQIDLLAQQAQLYPADEDLQLLLGYQLLGAGKLTESQQALATIDENFENATAAAKLLELVEKIKTTDTKAN